MFDARRDHGFGAPAAPRRRRLSVQRNHAAVLRLPRGGGAAQLGLSRFHVADP